MDITDVIIAPLISEKSMKDALLSRFTFVVSSKADKTMIRKAVQDKFKVNVVSVATVNVKGRQRKFGAKRIEVTLPSWKKAMVQLKPGEKIDLFETQETK